MPAFASSPSGLPREPAEFLEAWLDAADRQAFVEEGWEVFTCLNESLVLRLPAGLNEEGKPLTRATLQVTRQRAVTGADAFEVHLVGARLNERRVCEGPALAQTIMTLLQPLARQAATQ